MKHATLGTCIGQLWHREPSMCETSLGPVAYQAFPIDTTFAMHRAGEAFRRLKAGIRVYEPYEALHLDWYRKIIGPNVYATTSSDGISHWNNAAEQMIHKDVQLEYHHFLWVQADEMGRLIVHRENL